MELNVLVIRKQNVGKSTLLNSLRSTGIKGLELISTLVLHFLNRLIFFYRYTKGISDFRKSRDDAGAYNASKIIIRSFRLCIRYTWCNVVFPWLWIGRG